MESSSAVIALVNTCIKSATAREDADYFACLWESGLIRRHGETCDFQCINSPFHSNACCDSIGQAQRCVAHGAQECKDLLDHLLETAFPCGTSAAGVLLAILGTIAILSLLLYVFAVSQYTQHKKLLYGEQWQTYVSRNWMVRFYYIILRKCIQMVEWSTRLRYMVWKNVVVKFRHPWSFAIEFCTPVLLALVLVLLSTLDVFSDRSSTIIERESFIVADFLRLHDSSLVAPAAQCQSVNGLLHEGTPDKSLLSFVEALQPTIGIYFLLGYLRLIVTTTSSMVREKEAGTQDRLYMMGVSPLMMAASWYLTHFALYSLLAIVLAIEFHFGGLFPMANFAQVFFFFWMFGWSIVSFSYAAASLSKKTRNAAVITSVTWLLCYLPLYSVEQKPRSIQLLAATLPPTALGLGLNSLVEDVQRGTGLYYAASLLDAPVRGTGINAATGMLVLDCISMFLFGWFMQHGKTMMKKKKRRVRSRQCPAIDADVVISHLSKQYNSEWVVRNMSLTLNQGEITCLLGHNGAGKTTTITMLTGQIEATCGDIVVFGQRDMNQIRRSLGVCSQQDIFYEDLTVTEELTFFAAINQVDIEAIAETVRLKVVQFMLPPNTKVNHISGGQRRCLSVAISLLGQKKLIVLDEPTSGMDVSLRNVMWNALMHERRERIIVVTTHFMDEADLHADNVAIMASGQLVASGKVQELKDQYASGYRLTISLLPGYDPLDLLDKIYEAAPKAYIQRQMRSTLHLKIPDQSDSASLYALLVENEKSCGIADFGVSRGSLQDVFYFFAGYEDRSGSGQEEIILPRTTPRKVSYQQHSIATFRKRLRHTSRDVSGIILTFVVPLVFFMILVLMPQIQVAHHIPSYKEAGSESLSNYGTCRSNLSRNEPMRQCAFGVELDPAKCRGYCQGHYRAECPSDNCRGEIAQNATFPRDLPYCMRNATVIPRVCETEWFSFCSLGLVDCNARECCNFRNSNSPYYPCSSCRGNTWACYKSDCLRKDDVRLQGAINGYILTLVLTMAYCLSTASSIGFVAREREQFRNIKQLQMISGLSPWIYWWCNWIWDILIGIISIMPSLIFLPFFDMLNSDPEAEGGIFVLLILFNLAATFLSYIYASIGTRLAAQAISGVMVFHVVSGCLLGAISTLCRFVYYDTSTVTLTTLDTEYLRFVYLIFPAYALHDGIFQIVLRQYGNPYGSLQGSTERCKLSQQCWTKLSSDCCVPGVFEWDIGGRSIVYLVFTIVGLVLILVVIESQNLFHCLKYKRETSLTVQEMMDDDVCCEAERVAIGGANYDPLLIENLSIQYDTHKYALRKLSLGIHRGECFGYLGVNGAGKSSTIRVLTGCLQPTSGRARIMGFDVYRERQSTRQRVGYCPQHEALLDTLSVGEHLELFARIKSIPEVDIEHTVRCQLKLFHLTRYRHTLIKALSGGAKRTVSVAIALLGQPDIVILDEPSNGMDPAARHRLWRIIEHMCRVRYCTIFLTSHSVNECESLCDRVGILRNGQLRCIGTVSHLTSKFSDAYRIRLKLYPPTVKQLEWIEQQINVPRKVITQEMLRSICDRLGGLERFERLRADLQEFLDSTGRIPVSVFCASWMHNLRLEEIVQYFQHKYQGVSIVESGRDFTAEISIPKESVPRMQHLFAALNYSRTAYGIENYTLSQSSLRDIFNRIANDTI